MFLGCYGFYVRKVKVIVGDAVVWQATLGKSLPCSSSGVKNVYCVIMCSNSLGGIGGMKVTDRAHTYAWLWHRELQGLAPKTMTNYVCHLSYQKMCWAQCRNDRLLLCPFLSLLPGLCHSQVPLSFLPGLISLSDSLLAVGVTKLLESLPVDSAVKCINSPFLSRIWYSVR